MPAMGSVSVSVLVNTMFDGIICFNVKESVIERYLMTAVSRALSLGMGFAYIPALFIFRAMGRLALIPMVIEALVSGSNGFKIPTTLLQLATIDESGCKNM